MLRPANRSRIILPPNYITVVAETLASAEPEDLDRLKIVLEEAQQTEASAEEVARKVEEEAPTASPLAALLRDPALPAVISLIVLLLAVIQYIHPQLQQQKPAPTITPDQVEEIITRVLDAQNDPAVETPAPPEEHREPRSGR